jgi:hypothetical protein
VLRRATKTASLAAALLVLHISAQAGAGENGDAAAAERAGEDGAAAAADTPPEPDERLSLHFQTTVAVQAHPAFHADYTGENSLHPEAESATAVVMNVAADLRLWHGGELIFNPELSGGEGISRTFGVAAFPSGIVYRVGNPHPALYLARLALRQRFELGGGRVREESGANQLAGFRDRDTLTFSIGRLAVTDVFDGNAYAHDATTQFFNWALFASGAWDYAADTRGYTWGALADLTVGDYSLRTGLALLPKYGNLLEMEWNIAKARAMMLEGQARYRLGGRPGSTRVLLFANQARMGSYEQAVHDPAAGLDVTATRTDGRKKYGFRRWRFRPSISRSSTPGTTRTAAPCTSSRGASERHSDARALRSPRRYGARGHGLRLRQRQDVPRSRQLLARGQRRLDHRVPNTDRHARARSRSDRLSA